MVARQPEMAPYLFVDVDCSRLFRACCPSNKNRDCAGASIREGGGNRESVEFEVPRISVGACCRIDGLFRSFAVCEKTHRRCVPANPNPDRRFADVRRRALFFGCGVRCDPRSFVCDFCVQMDGPENRRRNSRICSGGLRPPELITTGGQRPPLQLLVCEAVAQLSRRAADSEGWSSG